MQTPWSRQVVPDFLSHLEQEAQYCQFSTVGPTYNGSFSRQGDQP